MFRSNTPLVLVAILLAASLFPFGASASTGEDASCRQLFDQAEWERVFQPCLMAAEAGSAEAQGIVGELYDRGQGVVADSAQAAHWWRLAAAQGHLPARNLLALKYYYGGSVFGREPGWPLDHAAAFTIWLEDAQQGVAASQFMVGEMYFKGKGTGRDLAEAWAWLQLSLGGGYKLATDVLVELGRIMAPADRVRGQQRLAALRGRIGGGEAVSAPRR